MIRFYAESERGATIILEPKIKAELPHTAVLDSEVFCKILILI